MSNKTIFIVDYNDGSSLEFPFTVDDLLEVTISNVTAEQYRIKIGETIINIPINKLIMETKEGNSILEKIQDIYDSPVSDIDTFIKVIENNEKFNLDKLETFLSAKEVKFIPKSEGLYIELSDNIFIPQRYVTLSEFTNLLNSEDDKLPLNQTEDNIRLMYVHNDGNLHNKYVSDHKLKNDFNVNNWKEKLNEILNVYETMNPLSKKHLYVEDITVL